MRFGRMMRRDSCSVDSGTGCPASQFVRWPPAALRGRRDGHPVVRALERHRTVSQVLSAIGLTRATRSPPGRILIANGSLLSTPADRVPEAIGPPAAVV